MMATRRQLLAATSLLLGGAIGRRARAADPAVLRVGFQKGEPVLVAAKQNRSLETLLAPLGISVSWLEFAFGPPILEAMRVGSIDIGGVGDTPPIFAQAAHADLVYIASRPSTGDSSAVLVPPGSTLQTLHDLKGRKVAFARGSSAQNLTLAALEKAGLTFADIQPIYLAPADAAAAFAHGDIDAWTIWDPYYAITEARPGVRVLASSKDITPQNSFYLASRAYAARLPQVIDKVVAGFGDVGTWCDAHKSEVAQLLSSGTGVPLPIMTQVVARTSFRSVPMTDALIADQQRIADRFSSLDIIPGKLNVRDYAWHVSA
jgi:NitT/TauT family transport system substrate-binding protein/sulfonate transport system substrate-binding protein